jgi:hypothetical protein
MLLADSDVWRPYVKPYNLVCPFRWHIVLGYSFLGRYFSRHTLLTNGVELGGTRFNLTLILYGMVLPPVHKKMGLRVFYL